jgi:hypothetical protein
MSPTSVTRDARAVPRATRAAGAEPSLVGAMDDRVTDVISPPASTLQEGRGACLAMAEFGDPHVEVIDQGRRRLEPAGSCLARGACKAGDFRAAPVWSRAQPRHTLRRYRERHLVRGVDRCLSGAEERGARGDAVALGYG